MRLRAVRAGTGRGRRPLAPRLRLSGAYGAVWWDCDPFVAPARLPLRHREIAVVLSSVLANEVAPRRASSPPWPPTQRDDLRFRQSGTQHPHLCTQVRNVTLDTGSRRIETDGQPGK